jgi:hypothetical protein
LKEVAEITATKVTQSAIYESDEKSYGPANAFDKYLSTEASVVQSNEVCRMKADLGNTYYIHKILIYYRFYRNWFYPNQWCAQNVSNYEYCVNKDNNVDVSGRFKTEVLWDTKTNIRTGTVRSDLQTDL